MSFKRIIIGIFLGQLIFFSIGSLVPAKADDLIIKDNGQVVLVITNDDVVLGESTAIKAPASTKVVDKKIVDKVVEQGTNGQPILNIKSDKADEVTLQQGTNQASTSLPIQINSATHVISVVASNGNSTKVSVLPKEALQGATQQGLITNSTNTKMTITQESGQVFYNISGNKTGKFLGLFNINSPVGVQLSAETGKITKVNQSPFLSIFGFLVK